MQIVSSIALISINETLVIQVISFLILLFVMNRIMLCLQVQQGNFQL